MEIKQVLSVPMLKKKRVESNRTRDRSTHIQGGVGWRERRGGQGNSQRYLQGTSQLLGPFPREFGKCGQPEGSVAHARARAHHDTYECCCWVMGNSRALYQRESFV